jgi:hypothetical protein
MYEAAPRAGGPAPAIAAGATRRPASPTTYLPSTLSASPRE